MSRSLNSVALIGNLGGDPEIRTTSNGNKVATFSVATSRQWTSASGEKQEKTEWHKCVAWNRGSAKVGLADICERYAAKGSKVYVSGRIEYREYEDRDKKMRHVTEINVTEVLLLSSPTHEEPTKRGNPGADQFEEFPGAMDGDDELPF